MEISPRPLDNVADVWLRKNPRTDVDDEGNTIYLADEVHILYSGECPSMAEIEADFDTLYTNAAAPETTLQDAIEAINMLSDIIFGGEL